MVDEKLNDYMYEFIVEICNDIGPRESGTEEEIKAGDRIEEELKKYCDETHQESYISSPHAFLGGIKYGALLVLVAMIIYWIVLLNDMNVFSLNMQWSLSLLIVAIVIIIITVLYFILEVMKYYETFDFLFPKKESKNVIGTIKPSEQAKNTVIFSAHHDSAFEFNTFYYLKRFGQIIINVGYLGVVIVLIAIVLRLILFILSIQLNLLFLVFGIIFLVFVPIVFVYIFFHSYKPVLGAFDNLSGVAVILGIAKILTKNKPKHTNVYLISFAGEESGLRGSKRYVKKYFDALKENKVKVVNMDSIAKKAILVIHDKESGIGAKHDPEIYESLYNIADEMGYNPKLSPLAFGATDAAAFSKKGISAVALGGLNLKEELAPYYHTRLDTPDVIEKESLGQVVDICLEYLKRLDDTS